jgi:hypothetical protein
MREGGLAFPIVVKPDVGQRGDGVVIARTEADLERALRSTSGDAIVQEYVAGDEFGIFYVRRPDRDRGRIFAITEKRFPEVVGDGRLTLEALILADDRAVCMAETYFDLHRSRLWDVPAAGERVRLVELGTHCRGAVFLDGAWARSEALEAAVDRIARGYDGFYFGRFDVRVPSAEALCAGRDIAVVELNAVTSEATNIYDPSYGLADAYRILCAQWRLAFEIGDQNRRRGHAPAPLGLLVRRIFAFVSA